jgi:sulfide:quinone oxidoreductase
MSNIINHDVVIVGGGTAGITVAAQLRRRHKKISIAIVEPASKHYYQPLWTLVGGGVTKFSDTERNESELIPPEVDWLQTSVSSFSPENNCVQTIAGQVLQYKFLVVCPGIQIDWSEIKGLTETLGKNGVCSNYSKETVEKTWEFLKRFTGGTAVFTFPNTPIKCAGAPQKIMYLAEHLFRKKNIRNNCRVIFATAGDKIFGVQKYADALNKIITDRNIEVMLSCNLESLDGTTKRAVFSNIKTNEIQEIHYDFIHVTPPMSSPDFIKTSPLSNETGWMDVDKATLRHPHYSNIYGLGDASSLPTSKTGAAIRKQAPVVVDHILKTMQGLESSKLYDGYTSCPLVTGYGRLILAEFDYHGQPAESFPFDQSKERLSMYLLKKYLLPKIYWNRMLKGKF